MVETSQKFPGLHNLLSASAQLLGAFAKRHKEALAISLLWMSMTLLVNPVGEFPLTDDWMYSHSVLTLLTHGRLELFDFQAMTAVGQILWGALFAKLFGFSMTTLRISVLILGLAGLWSTQGFLRSAGSRPFLTFWGVLTLATTPLYFGIANSFLTDIPFYALTVTSFVFFIRYLQRETKTLFVAGSLFAIIAILTRQLALIIPISFSLAYLTHKGLSRKTLIRIGVLCVITFGAFWAYDFFIKNTIGRPFLYYARMNAFKTALSSFGTPLFLQFLSAFFWRASVNLVYLGVFLLPFLLLLLPSQWRRLNPLEKTLSAAITLFHGGFAVIFGSLAHHRFIMPSGISYICDFYFGTITVAGSDVTTPAPRILWIAVTALGMLGAGIILSNFLIPLFRFFRNRCRLSTFQNAWVWVLCISACFFYFVPWGISGQFDRYNTFYMPFVLLLVLHNTGEVPQHQLRVSLPLASVLMMLIGFYSVAGTHDYLSWNRVRWGILRGLMQQGGVSPKEIDGGYEFNGWYTYNSAYKQTTQKSWWWVLDDKYIVSFKMFDGYEMLQVFPNKRWLPPYKAPPLLLLRRMENQITRS